MEDWKDFGNRLSTLAGSWTAYTALGSFALYLLGYLSLRFHLTALGVGTDLSVLDERYLFTGAKFLIFLMSMASVVSLLALILAAVIYLPYRLLLRSLPSTTAAGVRYRMNGLLKRFVTWWNHPTKLALAGTIVAVLTIQLLMKQCLNFSNLLVTKTLGEPAWLHPLILGETRGWWALYFPGLIIATVVSGVLLLAAHDKECKTLTSRLLTSVLTSLVFVQFLLLPINYGYLYLDKTLPKVADLGKEHKLAQGQEAWLVWEGNAGMTYLVRSNREDGNTRSLITLPKQNETRTEIIGYDQILCVVFRNKGCAS